MKLTLRIDVCLCSLLLLLVVGCERRSEWKPPAPRKHLTRMGTRDIQATCSANKLTVRGEYAMRGREGDMLLLLDGQERARLSMKQSEDHVPFSIECSDVSPGEHECRLVFDGTITVAMPNGELGKETVTHARIWGPRRIVCN